MAIDIVDAAVEFLDARKVTLWGRSFDVIQEDSRRQAAEWLVDTLSEFEDFLSDMES